jgi:anti-anti-sigma factor
MIEATRKDDTLEMRAPSALGATSEVVKAFREFVGQQGVAAGEGGMVLVVRELVNNAIEHGHKRDESKTVRIRVEHLSGTRFKLIVSDEGDGFDVDSAEFAMSDDPDQLRSRGLALVNVFADEISFNETGNEVTVYMTAPTETEYRITNEDGLKIIHPTGDITAETSETFRATLLDLIEAGESDYRFDLTAVDDIDSISLSIFVIFANMARKKFENPVLELSGANKDIKNLFELTRLTQSYTILD